MAESDSSPPPKGRKPLPVAPPSKTPSPPVHARIKRVKQVQVTPIPPARISARRFQLQADEDSCDGRSSAQEANSSDDEDETNLSYVSNTSQHPDADPLVYAAGASSQGGFPTPLHQRRGADRGLLSLAGDITRLFDTPPFQLVPTSTHLHRLHRAEIPGG
jgi:hypothetical protein